MKKFITFILVFTMLLGVFACTKTENEKPETGITTTPESTTEPITETTDNGPKFPEIDYDGTDFRVSMMNATLFNKEFFCEEDSDDPLWSSTWRRNVTVEDQFNVDITPIYATPDDSGMWYQMNQIMVSVLTDQNDFDLTASFAVTAGSLITGMCLLDWGQMEYTNLDASYWTKNINDKFTIADHVYTVVGDTNVSALDYTYAIYYNRTEGNTRGLTAGILDAIENKSWTIDYFFNIVKDIYDDVDDTNGRSAGDFYGFQAEALTNVDNYNFAFDIDMIVPSGDDSLLKCVFDSSKTVGAIDKIIKLYWECNGTFISPDAQPTMPAANFKAGNSLFITATLGCCFGAFRDMEDHYSVFPYPMYDENQETYYTGMMDNFTVLGIPLTAPDPEMTSIITEALNYYAEEIMTPVFYEESLCKKFANDGEETVMMLDYLMDGRRCDLAVIMQRDVAYLPFVFRKIVQSKTNTFRKYYDGISETINTQLGVVVDKYIESSKL
jgi:hypothetical protein